MGAPVTTKNKDGTKTTIFTENPKPKAEEIAKPKIVKPVKIVKMKPVHVKIDKNEKKVTKNSLVRDLKLVESAEAAWKSNKDKETIDEYRTAVKIFAEKYNSKLDGMFEKPKDKEEDFAILQRIFNCADEVNQVTKPVFGSSVTGPAKKLMEKVLENMKKQGDE
ncbi:Uncharacterised protein [Candidatus Gugararchaeum adminiculabundum]|nr:Uncharacterised protein [Candidatus Gugararchaeum adminiculabundum]